MTRRIASIAKTVFVILFIILELFFIVKYNFSWKCELTLCIINTIIAFLLGLDALQLFQYKCIERQPGVAYLHRLNLIGLGRDSSLFSVKLHQIVISDSECLHDHPWPFISILLKGSYLEYRQFKSNDRTHKAEWCPKNQAYVIGDIYFAGNILFRPANWLHSLRVIKPVWTLVLTGPKSRRWGFLTKNGWKHWRDYNESTDC